MTEWQKVAPHAHMGVKPMTDTNTASSGNTAIEAAQARINAEYVAMKPAQKAAFRRRLKEAGNLPLPTVPKKTSEQDRIIAEIKTMPVEQQQVRVDEIYIGYTRSADKAAFTRRLQAATLPMPSTPKKVASEQDKLIAELAAMLSTAAPVAPAAPTNASGPVR
jgi:predicted Abi (CAAX) family protease